MAENVGAASVDLEVDKHQFGRSVRAAVDGNRGLLGGLGKAMGETVSGAFSSALSIGKTVAKGAAVVGAGVLALGGVVAGTGIKIGNTLEKTELQFETLTGSAEQAHKIVQDLFTFAKRTPFETGPVIEAARSLQTFGGAALNTNKNLTLVGDAAAATSSEITEVAFWTGRAYSAIQAGRPFGEAAARLQELAILSPKARAEMERLQASGAANSEVWKVMETDLGRFNGAMSKQAGTWEGLTSTLSDSWKLSSQRVFEPFRQLLKDVTGDAISFTESPVWDRWVGVATARVGEVADSLQTLRTALKDTFAATDDSGGVLGIGNTISQLASRLEQDMPRLSTALDQIGTFLSGIDTSKGLGQGVGEALLGIFDGVDPTRLAGKATDLFVGMTEHMDFQRFSEAMSTFVINSLLNLDIPRLVSALIPISNNLIIGFIEGIFRAATEHPLDFALLLVSLGFTPGRFVTKAAEVLAKIPLVGPFMGWILEGLAGLGRKLVSPIKSLIEPLGGKITAGLKTGAEAGLGKLTEWFGGLGRKLVDALPSPGKILVDVGKKIMGGLLDGLKSAVGGVLGFLGDLTKKIPLKKGPPETDRKLLVGNGVLIMQGLDHGLRVGYRQVESTLAGVATNIRDGIPTPEPVRVKTAAYGDFVSAIDRDSDDSRGGAATREPWIVQMVLDERVIGEVTSEQLARRSLEHA